MSNSIEIWKIRQKSTGLFSRGGTLRHPYDDSRAWSKKGKSWKQINHLRSHLNLAASFYRQQQDDIEVVKLVMVVDDSHSIRHVVSNGLIQAGFQVITAENGKTIEESKKLQKNFTARGGVACREPG